MIEILSPISGCWLRSAPRRGGHGDLVVAEGGEVALVVVEAEHAGDIGEVGRGHLPPELRLRSVLLGDPADALVERHRAAHALGRRDPVLEVGRDAPAGGDDGEVGAGELRHLAHRPVPQRAARGRDEDHQEDADDERVGRRRGAGRVALALSTASRDDGPSGRRPSPTRLAKPFARTGPPMSVPRNRNTGPAPTASPNLAAMPPSSSAPPRAIITRPMTPRTRLVPLRSTRAVRIATIGLVRPARQAGKTAETNVTIVPATITSTTANGVTRSGMPPEPVRLRTTGMAAPSSRKRPMPASTPMALATTPTTSASSTTAATDLAAPGADGAQQRELPDALGDDDRERVVDDEHGHEERHPRERLQHGAQHIGDALGVAGRLAAQLVARPHLVLAPDGLAHALGQRRLGQAGRALDVDGVVGRLSDGEEGEAVGLAHHDVAVRARRVLAPVAGQPHDLDVVAARRGRELQAGAGAPVLAAGGVLVDGDLARLAGGRALDHVVRIERRHRDEHGTVGLLQHRGVALDHVERARQVARGCLDPRRGPHLAEQGGWEPRSGEAPPGLPARRVVGQLRLDGRVDPRERRDGVGLERRTEGVLEHQGPGQEAGADDDRQHGRDEADRLEAEAGEGQAEHERRAYRRVRARLRQ